MRQTYHDKHGTRIGYTDQSINQITAYSRDGTRLGYYQPRSDTTYTASGARMGRGNLLPALIWGGVTGSVREP